MLAWRLQANRMAKNILLDQQARVKRLATRANPKQKVKDGVVWATMKKFEGQKYKWWHIVGMQIDGKVVSKVHFYRSLDIRKPSWSFWDLLRTTEEVEALKVDLTEMGYEEVKNLKWEELK